MDDKTLALIVGISFGFGVVALAIGFFLLAKNSQPDVVLSNNGATTTYKNEERWSVVKDSDGRVRDIIVHREATQN